MIRSDSRKLEISGHEVSTCTAYIAESGMNVRGCLVRAYTAYIDPGGMVPLRTVARKGFAMRGYPAWRLLELYESGCETIQ